MGSPTLPVRGALREKMEILERYRTFWERFWAGFVDGLVFVPIGLLNNYISKHAQPGVLLICWAIFQSLTVLGYSILMHARYGQTVGKMFMGVKVWDVSESRLPSLKQAFLRDIGNVVPNVAGLVYLVFLMVSHQYTNPNQQLHNLPGEIIGWAGSVWFLLEVVTMLTNQKRRALHDFIARTVVCID